MLTDVLIVHCMQPSSTSYVKLWVPLTYAIYFLLCFIKMGHSSHMFQIGAEKSWCLRDRARSGKGIHY